AGASRGADAHAQRRGRPAREAGVARQEDAGDVAAPRVDERGLRFEERLNKAAAVAQAERAVGVDRVHAETDLVQVRDDDDWPPPIALACADPEIAGGVRLGAGPAG